MDCLDFIKAFNICKQIESRSFVGIENEIITKLKGGINSQRKDFTINNNLEIDPYWLLGFVEAEGSFTLSFLTPEFSFFILNIFKRRTKTLPSTFRKNWLIYF